LLLLRPLLLIHEENNPNLKGQLVLPHIDILKEYLQQHFSCQYELLHKGSSVVVEYIYCVFVMNNSQATRGATARATGDKSQSRLQVRPGGRTGSSLVHIKFSHSI